MDFGPEVLHGLSSVFVWGDNRTAVAATALAVARQGSPSLAWLEIRDLAGKLDDYEPILRGLIPPSRRFQTRTPAELQPEVAAANITVWSLIRSDEPGTAVAQLMDFLRLPQSVQALTAELVPVAGVAVLLVTNVDRIGQFYPEEVESTRPFLETLKLRSIKVVSSYAGLQRKDRMAYDFVFRITGGGAGDWRSLQLIVEKGMIPANSAGARPTNLRDIESLREVVAPRP